MPTAVRSAVMLLLLLSLAACSWSGGAYKAETTLTQTVEHASGGALEIKTRNGRVEVTAEPDRPDVSIEAAIRARGASQTEADQRLAATTISAARDAAGKLTIEPVFPPPSGRYSDSASFVVRVPDAHGVYIDTSNGSIVVRDLSGDLNVDTSNGSVRVTNHAGDVYADTSNGTMVFDNVDGVITADTSNGAITVALAPGHPGPLNLDTSNGPVRVEVGDAFAGTVLLGTSNGWIDIADHAGRIREQRVSRSDARLKIGEGGASSRISTSNGTIKLKIGS